MYKKQITLSFDVGMASSYGTCREYVAARVHQHGKPQKAIAADMDYSPSDLSRKLAQNPDDSRRFTLDDLETYISVTGDTQPVLYLVEKFLTNRDDQIARLQAEIDRLKAKQ